MNKPRLELRRIKYAEVVVSVLAIGAVFVNATSARPSSSTTSGIIANYQNLWSDQETVLVRLNFTVSSDRDAYMRNTSGAYINYKDNTSGANPVKWLKLRDSRQETVTINNNTIYTVVSSFTAIAPNAHSKRSDDEPAEKGRKRDPRVGTGTGTVVYTDAMTNTQTIGATAPMRFSEI